MVVSRASRAADLVATCRACEVWQRAGEEGGGGRQLSALARMKICVSAISRGPITWSAFPGAAGTCVGGASKFLAGPICPFSAAATTWNPPAAVRGTHSPAFREFAGRRGLHPPSSPPPPTLLAGCGKAKTGPLVSLPPHPVRQ